MIDLGGGSYSIDKLPKWVKVGKYCSIAANVKFFQRSDNHLCKYNKQCVYTTYWDQPKESGEIRIGNDVWICEGVRILPDTIIGDGCIIGTGAVVGGTLPPYTVWVGNPAVQTRERFSSYQISRLDKIKWWDWDYKVIQERLEDLKNIDTFISKYG